MTEEVLGMFTEMSLTGCRTKDRWTKPLWAEGLSQAPRQPQAIDIYRMKDGTISQIEKIGNGARKIIAEQTMISLRINTVAQEVKKKQTNKITSKSPTPRSQVLSGGGRWGQGHGVVLFHRGTLACSSKNAEPTARQPVFSSLLYPMAPRRGIEPLCSWSPVPSAPPLWGLPDSSHDLSLPLQ